MEIQQFQEKLLHSARNAGFDEAEVYFEKSSSFQVMVFEGEIDSYETSEEGGVGLRGLYDGKMGYAYTEKIEDDSIPFLIDSAKANAEVLDEDDGADIFAGSDRYIEHSSYNEALDSVPIPDKIDFLKEVEQKTRDYDPRILALNYCVLQDFSSEKALTNSKGLSLHDRSNGLIVFVSAVAKDGEEMKTGASVRLTRDFQSLDADAIAKEAAEEALAQLGETTVPSKQYPVILRHDAAASLLAAFTPIFSAEEAQKGQSLLNGKVGDVIGAEHVTLIDDPFHKDSLFGGTFDGEGVATRETVLIAGGVLETLLHNRKTAKKEGMNSTGHGSKASYKGTLTVSPHSLYVAPGVKTEMEMIAGVPEGILVTGLSGLHSGTNPISGEFSLAASGFFIQDGKISVPVKQMTIAGNFFDFLKSIDTVGSDLKFVPGGCGSPSLKVSSLSVTVE
ncbi:peptidase [Sporosarcina sp. NCCP-2716]|uniref:TldD/PmbA family protein n=1 Tax=Sporosarcina sp. NCCP-2716 TaxID=2943679 RepID=UPI00203B8445|nr:TldD/PmbA family protein [Sporosarcina sp. NCCP-2716]GKV68870.1 peptidase [Sporosarcina sp. NCCP-2716]